MHSIQIKRRWERGSAHSLGSSVKHGCWCCPVIGWYWACAGSKRAEVKPQTSRDSSMATATVDRLANATSKPRSCMLKCLCFGMRLGCCVTVCATSIWNGGLCLRLSSAKLCHGACTQQSMLNGEVPENHNFIGKMVHSIYLGDSSLLHGETETLAGPLLFLSTPPPSVLASTNTVVRTHLSK